RDNEMRPSALTRVSDCGHAARRKLLMLVWAFWRVTPDFHFHEARKLDDVIGGNFRGKESRPGGEELLEERELPSQFPNGLGTTAFALFRKQEGLNRLCNGLLRLRSGQFLCLACVNTLLCFFPFLFGFSPTAGTSRKPM